MWNAAVHRGWKYPAVPDLRTPHVQNRCIRIQLEEGLMCQQHAERYGVQPPVSIGVRFLEMPDWIVDIAKIVLPGLVVAIVTSIVTLMLSLRRLYAEKWWEKRHQVYGQLFESLHLKNIGV